MRIMHIPITFAVKHKIEMNKNEQYMLVKNAFV